MRVVLTMAGDGTRFKRAGYDTEKYAIDFRGHSLFAWSLASLIALREHPILVVTRDWPGVHEHIRATARNLGFAHVETLTLTALTRGQAETAVLAGPFVGPEESVVIWNTDTFVCPNAIGPHLWRGDGSLPCFTAEGDRWSFALTEDDDRVVRTTEKERISDRCSVGLYYFRRFGQFADLVAGIEADNPREWYIAPLYNRLIAAGGEVYAPMLPDDSVAVLGTPEDLALAEQRPPVFPESPK